MVLAGTWYLELVADLIEAGLATMQVEQLVTGGRKSEVRRVKITDAGRRALAERRDRKG
jgi:hypothetical protein